MVGGCGGGSEDVAAESGRFAEATTMLRTVAASGRRWVASRRWISNYQVSEEVQQAIAEHRPVVALESTIYTHGFPYPDNLTLAKRLESLVRSNGGVPATIAILDGIARVGLSPNELEQLVNRPALKVSRRDLGFACALTAPDGRRMNGGTTVSGTMILAHRAGIRIFATGGLGGVHRGGEVTMDVSADLTELGRTPVAVVSSGCKSFLDIPRTLEYLETQGVAVATFAQGRKDVDFPAFYTRESGIASPNIIRDEKEAAAVVHAHLSLGLQSGLLFANPIPEQHSIPLADMEVAIAEALREAPSGASSTPYILAKICSLTGSKSQEANIALVEDNVIRGAKMAVSLAKLEQESSSAAINSINNTPNQPPPLQTASIFVVGSINLDTICTLPSSPEFHTSNPSKMHTSLGGVGYNIALSAHLTGGSVLLCSALGDDPLGTSTLTTLQNSTLPTTCIAILPGLPTCRYIALNNPDNSLLLATSDTSLLSQTLNIFHEIWLPALQSHKPSHIVLDANLPPEVLQLWLAAARALNAHITFEPVSTTKGCALFTQNLTVYPDHTIDLITPNGQELTAMHSAARKSGLFERKDWWEVINALGIPPSSGARELKALSSESLVERGVPQQCIQLLPFFPTVCVKLGGEGVLVVRLVSHDKGKGLGYEMRLFPPPDVERARSVNGAGDAFVGVLVRELSEGRSVVEGMPMALRAAGVTLETEGGVGDLRVLNYERGG
ncbi:hypothetical protein K470DRAFT_255476 [Piedraia hortae CBS 480.64]|uniref:Carbohydrate kinase PfkB domain-containing protein n=1 Tax=Piedraia hortae CBS 480.64 TaxID=1314780 RepID=A0A6A7C6T0_9PEZI|nr:hypothetical protein K470DRAFT_255476 [Piedraia hortae CBS 480.64]